MLRQGQKALKLDLEHSLNAVPFWLAVALEQNKIASLETRLGQREAGEKGLRSALETYRRSRQTAEHARLSPERNLSALKDLGNANSRIAFVWEQLGGLKQALQSWREALSNAESVLKIEPGDPDAKIKLDNRRSEAVRIEWLMEGERGDYRALLGGEATPRQVRELLAAGWRHYSGDLLQSADTPFPLRVEAIEKAVELDRALVAEDAQPKVRLSLALGLQELAAYEHRQAVWTEGAERSRLLEQERAELVESRNILTALKDSGTLPNKNLGDIADVGNRIATVDAMSGAQKASR